MEDGSDMVMGSMRENEFQNQGIQFECQNCNTKIKKENKIVTDFSTGQL